MLLASAVLLLGLDVGAAKSTLRQLEQKYGIEIQWEYEYREIQDGWTVSCLKADGPDLAYYTPLLVAGMKLYPDEVWKSGKIEKIVLGKKLLKNGVSWGGFALTHKKTLMVNAEAWNAETFHHEVFHMLDEFEESRWSALNPSNFAYRPLTTKNQADSTNRQAGFITSYARTSPKEDRADLFSAMMGDPKGTKDRVKRDDLLRGKVDALKGYVGKYGFTDEWWRKHGL